LWEPTFVVSCLSGSGRILAYEVVLMIPSTVDA
jgi:hypothetical protein